jgi:hypothetical protein
MPGLGNNNSGGGSTKAGSTSIPPPDGCTDHDPSVIATCLNQVAAVAALPSTGDPAALAVERTTGRILRAQKGVSAAVVTTLQVDATGDGGLTGISLSPTYSDDQLIFAYVTTPTDNRVVRISADGQVKPILTGIPRGANGNRGALAIDPTGALLVATGNAGGTPDAASLAGKVLRINTSGASRIVATGLHAPGGICASADGKSVYVTDQGPTSDQLLQLSGSALSMVWNWPNKPGVAGCAVTTTDVFVGASTAANVQDVSLNKDGSVAGTPSVEFDGTKGYGRVSGMSLATSGLIILGTVNKNGGKPVSSDDRVVVISASGAASSKD